jgi:hypothetical protein
VPEPDHAAARPVSHLPPWSRGELPPPPVFNWRALLAMIGPGLTFAGASIGGGEWLLGPAVTAQYGGALLWVATLSLWAQYFYNLEASRYTLYTGELIMVGKFRTRPGPGAWLLLYLLLDAGSLLPYQIASAATPVVALWRGALPDPARDADLLRWVSVGLMVFAMLPLVVGGKIYTSVKAVMVVKVVVVFGFLLVLAFGWSSVSTWQEIGSGLFRVGEIPMGGGRTENVLVAVARGTSLPHPDRDALLLLAAFAAIAGVGGLQQTTISNYTRDQGWGMGARVGAIPTFIGGRAITLSHQGMVFEPTPDQLHRWRGWLRHVRRDQLLVWAPGALVGVALPAMLSIEFLQRGTVANQWILAGLTADGVAARVGGVPGAIAWTMVLVCGALVLVPNTTSSSSGFLARWTELAWTGAGVLRSWDVHRIRPLYFGVLVTYVAVAIVLLLTVRPLWLIVAYGNLGNLALGISAWHVLYVNTTLLPPALRPGWGTRAGLFLGGCYFIGLAMLTLWVTLR